jgi:branched-subunit amino acid aminotransferase/4-amino-4-deoxychorismate lyase
MAEKVYLNNKLIDADEAKITIFDTGLLHGVGLFETLRCYRGKPYRLADHIERMKESSLKLGIIVDGGPDDYQKLIDTLLVENGLSDARVRITVTAGSARVGIYTDAQASPTTIVTCGPMQTNDQIYQSGVGMLLCDYRLSESDPVARHKTTSYLPRLLALRNAQRINMADALWFTTGGFLAGGSIGNIFLFKDDEFLTPSLDLPVIPGVTRKIVMDIAREIEVPVVEGKFSLQDTLDATEIFLTNSTMEVIPVVAIEKHTVGNGEPGPVTRSLLQRYRRNVRKELDL